MRRSTCALALILLSAPAWAGPRTLEIAQAGVSFEVPEHCAPREGPGTLEAVCDPAGSAERSAQSEGATALFFEVAVESAPEDKGLALDALAGRYGFGQFEKDLPEAVCGEEQPTRVRIENALQLFEGGRIVYTASVLCPEIKFLGLAQRRAVARTVLGDGQRYHVLARALAEDFDRVKPDIDRFFKSLRLGQGRTP